MDLLLTSNEQKSHYVYIRDFMCKKMCNKTFCRCCLQSFSSEKILIKHKENCLIINGKQNVKLKKGSIEFKNHFKQLAVPFKICADFESLLKGVQSSYKNNSSYAEKYQDHIPCSFAYKVLCGDNEFSKRIR